MTISTVPDVPSKIYEIEFSPITLTSPMRKVLFEFFQNSVFLAHQAEAFALENISLPFQAILLKAVNEFNINKRAVEDFIISN